MALIKVNALEKIYHDEAVLTPVLRGVSFEIKEGEFVAIMGPSGSGKSTLLHLLGFLEKPTSGEYRFNDRTIDEYSDEEVARVRNKKMGFVFQSFNLLPRTTVLENVKLPLLYSEVDQGLWDNMARQAIESVGLSHRVDFEPSQLSGGEKQRVAIARALVNNPQVIFADEPTGNLDSKSGEIVMDIIQKLTKEKGHTVILITHETYTAEYAERIIRLRDGMIESDAKVTKRSFGSEFIK
ncbi:MAG: macrolide ABC transporter ATP-binding protein [Candidatus Lloydbacteria bacterium RIFCSPHIGHO2_01_FULL_41_20]|uniref:Macrolide ABC transporter ATP-binding protein n=1 Tax=Candidatus Lloydbacteria bacterium RIFCSPHIGHO2_01_FULL_41_20 TaxID=1798657 RepID=A0A1G2CQP6_9BACT|nr:MAG: macrolide ABC transporter ATP-binding protein [Candidatus Lloydbacteria bacterium RIFCSPHIGHO2_01_FULL_41_20]